MPSISDQSTFPPDVWWPVFAVVFGVVFLRHALTALARHLRRGVSTWCSGSRRVCDAQRAAGAHPTDCIHCRRLAEAASRGWWRW